MTKKKQEPKNYGSELDLWIKKNGISKLKMAENLGITAEWLRVLRRTGNFNPEMLKQVKKIIRK